MIVKLTPEEQVEFAKLRASMEKTAQPKPRKLEVIGWDGALYIRDLMLEEVEAQQADMEDKNDKRAMARAAARKICNMNGKQLYDPADDADVKLLATQPWRLIRLVLADEPVKT